MKKIFISAICIATTLAFLSCGSNATGPANEVLSKKAFSAAIAKYDDVGDFNEGVAIVKIEDGWRYKSGLIDSKGKEVVACIYKHLSPSSCGTMLFEDDHGYGYINTKGQVVVKSGVYEKAYDFTENLACVRKNTKYGFIDVKGNEVIPCTYDRAYPFSDGIALVYNNKKYGYINTKAEFVVAPSYDDGEFFSCGVAITRKGNKYYVIDTKGSVIFSIDRNKSEFLEDQFSENLIPVIREQNNKLMVGYLNIKGEEVIPFEYQYGLNFEDGTALVMKDFKVYKINTKCTLLGEEKESEILIDFIDDAKEYVTFTGNILIQLLGKDAFEDYKD